MSISKHIFTLALSLTLGTSAFQVGTANAIERVFTLTNTTSENMVQAFAYVNKVLVPAGTFSTGGKGSGGSLSNQGALVESSDRKYMLAVNPGSNDISVFRVVPGGLVLSDKASSGGAQPVSIAVRKRVVYVLNAGGVNNVSGFRLSTTGKLRAIEGSTRSLSADSTGPAEVGFGPDGNTLIVTERLTDKIVAFHFDDDSGLTSNKVVTSSDGQTPFGFEFDRDGTLIVAEAFGGAASAASSYYVREDSHLRTISSSIQAGAEKAACWVKLNTLRHMAFVTNTGTNSVSMYHIEEGRLTLVDAVSGHTGMSPTDMDIDESGSKLVVLGRQSGSISIFQINPKEQSLTLLSETVGLPLGSATGLLVR